MQTEARVLVLVDPKISFSLEQIKQTESSISWTLPFSLGFSLESSLIIILRSILV